VTIHGIVRFWTPGFPICCGGQAWEPQHIVVLSKYSTMKTFHTGSFRATSPVVWLVSPHKTVGSTRRSRGREDKTSGARMKDSSIDLLSRRDHKPSLATSHVILIVFVLYISESKCQLFRHLFGNIFLECYNKRKGTSYGLVVPSSLDRSPLTRSGYKPAFSRRGADGSGGSQTTTTQAESSK
jgi:hypothetical protein